MDQDILIQYFFDIFWLRFFDLCYENIMSSLEIEFLYIQNSNNKNYKRRKKK